MLTIRVEAGATSLHQYDVAPSPQKYVENNTLRNHQVFLKSKKKS
jgi:hypothetical protein